MNRTLVGVGALAACHALLSAPAMGHHSVAMFDHDRKITLQGTVKEFQYTNPHSWLQILVTDDGGRTVQWDLEAEGPSTLLRKGIKASTFSPGDKVTVVAHPMKDGRTAGALLSATSADRHVYAL